MKINDFILSKHDFERELSYFWVLRWMLWALWCGITRPAAFEQDGVMVENHSGHGTLRVLASGVVMAAVGSAMVALGLFGTLVLLAVIPLTPVIGLFAWISARRSIAKHKRDYERAVQAARDGVGRV